ncbi:MAG TPA: hemerythrin domain-containing protein [Candidatus Baltobacteraceae bacterium]|nr:hemerythrin domain-containing protein [Candidatus Baltobacteraceae bacterium]
MRRAGNDHEVIKGLLDSLTRSTARDERTRFLEQLKGALTIHNAMEENLIYPALDKVAGHMLETQKLYHETASADIMFFQIDTMLKEGDETKFAEMCKKAHDAVFKHIEGEEQHAMPHLQRGVDSSESQLLLQSVREFRGAIRFMPDGATGRIETGEITRSTSPASTRIP